MADGEPWEVWHHTQTRDILNLVAATERQAGLNTETEPLQFERLVTADGEPGTGSYKTSRIVT